MRKIIVSVTVALNLSLFHSFLCHAQSSLYPQRFDLSEVTLGEGPLRTAMKVNVKELLQYDTDRLMAGYIRQAGLADDAKSKYYNWEKTHPSFVNWGGGNFNLDGHVGGHYMTALALAYAATKNDAALADEHILLKNRIDYILSILKDCQDAYDNDTEGMYGFIGGQPMNDAWKALYKGDTDAFFRGSNPVPLYCQHKVLAGLRDIYAYTDDDAENNRSTIAKGLFAKMCDWTVNLVSRLTDTQMQRVLGNEHGGINEPLADAYLIFKDCDAQKAAAYLAGAKRYSHQAMINGMQDGYSRNFLDGRHANTQVPKYVGFERVYQQDASMDSYHLAALNFWTDVATRRTVCIGGNSISEHFVPAGKESTYMSNLEGPESCNTNNMLKLSEELFETTHDARYTDFQEAAIWNHILSTQDPETGGYVYFTTLRPQGYRVYSVVNKGMWCCVGTGMENHSKYGGFIYTHSEDNATLYVNMFTPSALDNAVFGIRQETTFPYSQQTTLTVTKSGKYAIAIRHPEWAGEKYSVSVNGADVATGAVKGSASYVILKSRKWKAGDRIVVSLPMELRYEECPGYGDYVAFKYGPVLMAARTTAATDAEAKETGLTHEILQNEYAGEGRMDHSPACVATKKNLSGSPLLIGERGKVLERVSTVNPVTLTATIDVSNSMNKWKTLKLEPFYNIQHARYQCYWYSRTAAEYAASDMGQADAEVAAIDGRTIAFVATGEQQSEAGITEASGSRTGSWSGEYYRDCGSDGYIQYTMNITPSAVKADSKASIMCRFTTADHGRKCTIKVNGHTLCTYTVPKNVTGGLDAEGNYVSGVSNESTFYNIEFAVPAAWLLDEKGNMKSAITFREEGTGSINCPGLYYLRALANTRAIYNKEKK